MKKTIIGSLCFLMTTLSWAQQKATVPVDCISLNALEDVLSQYDEIPFVRGKSVRETTSGVAEHPTVLFMNPKDRSWTLVERVGDLYCVLGVGIGLEPVPASIVDDIVKKRERSRS